MRGYLEITYGPMYSGKTTELIRKMNRYLDSGGTLKTLLVNNSIDKRECNSQVDILTSHATSSQRIHPAVDQITSSKLKDINFDGYGFVNIDESQFFEDLYDVVKLLVNKGVIVHCCGLIGDANQDKFGSLLDLFPIADELIQRKARCHCARNLESNAVFTRLAPGCQQKSQIAVGSDIYIPVCGKHL